VHTSTRIQGRGAAGREGQAPGEDLVEPLALPPIGPEREHPHAPRLVVGRTADGATTTWEGAVVPLPPQAVGMGVFFWSPQCFMALGPALVPHSAHPVIGVGPRNNLRGDGRENRTGSNPRRRVPPNEITNARERWRKEKIQRRREIEI